MPKKYDKEDVATQRELQDMHTTLNAMSIEMTAGFKFINARLDTMNGSVRANDKDIAGLKVFVDNQEKNAASWVNTHVESHKNYETEISRKVSFYSIIASILGVVITAVMGVIAWFSGLFK